MRVSYTSPTPLLQAPVQLLAQCGAWPCSSSVARLTVSGWLLSSDQTVWDSASWPGLRLCGAPGALAVDWGVAGALAALAAVLMVTSFRMISGSTVVTILRSTRSDALTFALTAVITVCFDLIDAVEIGILVAAFFALRTVARRSSVTREELPGPAQPGDERIALLRLDGAMFFGAAERISTAITDPEHHDVRVVIIRMSQLGMLDATGANSLATIVADLVALGLEAGEIAAEQARSGDDLRGAGALSPDRSASRRSVGDTCARRGDEREAHQHANDPAAEPTHANLPHRRTPRR